MSSSNECPDDPSPNTAPPSSSLVVEQGAAQTREGPKEKSSFQSRFCRGRYAALALLLALAIFFILNDTFERRDVPLPEADGNNVATPLNNTMGNNKEEGNKQNDEEIGNKQDDQEDIKPDDEEGDKQDEEEDIKPDDEGSEVIDDEEEDVKPDDEGSEVIDDEDEEDQPTNDDENHNKIDLDYFNPNRDGVEFISPTCNYTCMTDRLPHESSLYPGQVLCNREHRFGITDDGEFFMQDCLLDTVKIIWSAKEAQLTPDQYPFHFELQKNGHFQIISDPTGEILLEDAPKRNVTFHYMCLRNPKLDCPYLHLHPDGVLVINWIDNQWMVRNVEREYLGLFPNKD